MLIFMAGKYLLQINEELTIFTIIFSHLALYQTKVSWVNVST